MEVYLGKIYRSLVFGNAAPSVPSFIGSKVIFWGKSFVRSEPKSHIFWRISIKFGAHVDHSQIYKPLVFGHATSSFPSIIGSNVTFWWKSCVRSAGHISWRISFKCYTHVHYSQIYRAVVFGDAPSSVPSFVGSKVIFWFTFLCGSNSCSSWRISFKFCMEVYLAKIYSSLVFGNAAPSVPSFIGSKVIFRWKSFVRSEPKSHIFGRISIKFGAHVDHSQIYKPLVFGHATSSIPSIIGSKSYFGGNLVCALQATFLDGFLSNVIHMCIIVKSTEL